MDRLLSDLAVTFRKVGWFVALVADCLVGLTLLAHSAS